MIIDILSDLHGSYPRLYGGDLLIISGDLTARDKIDEYFYFRDWLLSLDYKKKIIIAGNHDGKIEDGTFYFSNQWLGANYLCDSETEFEGLRIWGSPWTPTFCNWHFMLNRGDEIKAKWDLIPADTDILVTHGPPFGTLDVNSDGAHVGCEMLKLAVERVKPKLHVFGHIHECGGHKLYNNQCEVTSDFMQDVYGNISANVISYGTVSVNAAIMDRDYEPTNRPQRIIL